MKNLKNYTSTFWLMTLGIVSLSLAPATATDQPNIIVLLADDGGYTTGLIGKWHQGGTAKYHPFRHGFDELFGFTHEGHYFVPPPWDGVTTILRRKGLPGGAKGRWVGDKKLIYTDHMGGDEPDRARR